MGSVPAFSLLAIALTGCAGAKPPTGSAEPSSSGAPELAKSAPKPAPLVAPADAELGERVGVLGGRLTLRASKQARIVPRPHDIMAADASNDDETRIILEPGTEDLSRFVFLAREAFALGSDDLAGDAKKLLGKEADALVIESKTLPSGLRAALLTPRTLSGAHGAVFIYGAIVERSDRTLCELSFYVLEDMQSEAPKYVEKARAMLASVESGKGKLVGAREQRIDTGSGSLLIVKLPRDTVMTLQRGPDFWVYHLRELSTVGAEAPEMGVYVGGFPAFQWKQTGIDERRVKKTKGTLLGKAVDWYSWEPNPGRVLHEAIATLGKGDRVHVFASGPSAAAGEFRRAAESMRVVTK